MLRVILKVLFDSVTLIKLITLIKCRLNMERPLTNIIFIIYSKEIILIFYK